MDVKLNVKLSGGCPGGTHRYTSPHKGKSTLRDRRGVGQEGGACACSRLPLGIVTHQL